MSISAYRRQREAAEMPRELERRAFTTTIGKWLEAKEKGGKQLIDACYLNQQLWTALLDRPRLAAERIAGGLKARLISIGIWVHRYTLRVMNGSEAGRPADLGQPQHSRRLSALSPATCLPKCRSSAPSEEIGIAVSHRNKPWLSRHGFLLDPQSVGCRELPALGQQVDAVIVDRRRIGIGVVAPGGRPGRARARRRRCWYRLSRPADRDWRGTD